MNNLENFEPKRIEGLWDCEYCGQKGIRARFDRCQGCGSPRRKETVFYMPADIASATLTKEEAAKTSNAPDWLCDYCGSLNSMGNGANLRDIRFRLPNRI